MRDFHVLIADRALHCDKIIRSGVHWMNISGKFEMISTSVVKNEIVPQAFPRMIHVLVFLQVDLLVFDRSPQPLHKDVVVETALSVHADPHTGGLQTAREVFAGELGALITVENLGLGRR